MRKYIKTQPSTMLAGPLIALAVAIRLALAGLGWPLINADEGTVAIAARHIAYNGELPIYFYGYDYMGLAQAYIGAALFHIFGPSLFTLRLGLILLYALLMVLMYAIANMLFSKPVALLTLGVMVLGSGFNLRYQLHAYGGYPEMLLLSALLFFIALKLAMTYQPDLSREKRWQRMALYGCCGLAAGLGVWSHALIAPAILFSGLLILIFCWRELVRITPVIAGLVGLGAGLFPVLYYNIAYALPGRDNINVLLTMFTAGGADHSLALLGQQTTATFLVSVPTVSGNPFCPINEVLALLEPNTPPSPLCMTVLGVWSASYLFLLAVALVITSWFVWHTFHSSSSQKEGVSIQTREQIIRNTGRLFLILLSLTTLIIYTLSGASRNWPGNHARYLLPLLFSTPCLLWIAWQGRSSLQLKDEHFPLLTCFAAKLPERLRRNMAALVLEGSIGLLLIGTVAVFLEEVPFVQTKNQQNEQLITYLEQHGVQHFYTGYWECNSLAFLSEEKLQCAVVSESLEPTHNRYKPYLDSTLADPFAAYVFTRGTDYIDSQNHAPAVEKQLQQQGLKYQHIVLDGFVIYLPE